MQRSKVFQIKINVRIPNFSVRYLSTFAHVIVGSVSLGTCLAARSCAVPINMGWVSKGRQARGRHRSNVSVVPA